MPESDAMYITPGSLREVDGDWQAVGGQGRQQFAGTPVLQAEVVLLGVKADSLHALGNEPGEVIARRRELAGVMGQDGGAGDKTWGLGAGDWRLETRHGDAQELAEQGVVADAGVVVAGKAVVDEGAGDTGGGQLRTEACCVQQASGRRDGPAADGGVAVPKRQDRGLGIED